MNARLLLPESPEDGGALSLPRCEDDNGAWGGPGDGVREGRIILLLLNNNNNHHP